ncbi:MAG: MarR family transcriptional regulator [Gordonia polyisoprenivorans]|nr:MarR family transcriptional regulator [Gordonia polyisoprenivorans]
MNARNDRGSTLSAAGALSDLAEATDRIREAVSDLLGVDRSAMAALTHLGGERPIGSVELAGRLNLSASSVTSLVDRLSAAGLAERTAHPTDRRKRVIVLTGRGEAAIEWLAGLRRALFANIPDNELIAATASMHRITKQLDKQVSRLRTGSRPPFA